MQIDRSRFLILSATIAAGCGPSRTDATEVKVATPVEMEPSAGDEPLQQEQVDDALVGQGDPGGGPSLQEMCEGLEPPPGPHCESFHDTKANCHALIDGLEAEAADKAVQCMASRSKTRAICRYDALQDCFLMGVASAVSEPRLDKQCASVVKMCASNRWARGDLNQASCGSALAAVKDHLEGTMISCMSESCGIGSCVWRIR
jgi:hypothetical protein